jgi:hypothetical protein
LNAIQEELLGETKKLTLPNIKISRKFLYIFLPIVVFGWYIIILLFGTNSIIRLQDLSYELENLKDSVTTIKKKNSLLQKELFEIQQLRGIN